ncbi:hypothetical protein QQS21_008139 [Conoideocrella luteorostrata]|uniref:YwbE n=1 Tax=Conoideocrella luteorostrata TaxID=1105319 RepID=A0AAJ0CJD3_9HYPO|nr:hypothetical protein QQS21_008139 [Conoideocrella luteorostrata]
MNRHRNRQPRPPRHQSGSSSQGSPTTPQQAAGAVPTIQQVVPGANVFIVLKQDQPSGKETAGVVAELLTRGNHPRGIKVRLQSGQVGRVQRIGDGSAASSGSVANPSKLDRSSRFSHRYTDVRNDLDYPSEPPARSLADFLPPTQDESDGFFNAQQHSRTAYVTVKCSLCNSFEGDETAVTHHIEREHLA